MYDLPTYDDVIAAAAQIAGHANRASVMSSCTPGEELGTEVFFKYENLQYMGAFKFRGAFNALSRSSAEQRVVGMVAFSSGNYAQATILSARSLRIPATVVMLAGTPAVKIEATRGYGEQIALYDRRTEGREQIGCSLIQHHGPTLIPPHDHPDVLAGQDTVTKGPSKEVGPLNAFFAPLGGGDLLSDCALAIRTLASVYRIYGVEPEANNDGQRSLRNGAIVHIDTSQTLADGAQTQHLGNLIFPPIQHNVDDILVANDTELVDGICSLATRAKLLAGPTGCLGLAIIHQHKDELRGRRVGVLLSDGNVNLVRFCVLLGDQPAAKGRVLR